MGMKEEKEKCKEFISYQRGNPNGFAMGDQHCSHNAWKDGCCRIHHPDLIRERENKRREKSRLEYEGTIFHKYPLLQKSYDELNLKHLGLIDDYIAYLEDIKKGFADVSEDKFFKRTIKSLDEKIAELRGLKQ